jgi:23S rRNA (guanine1835-N2)-methyltransferase
MEPLVVPQGVFSLERHPARDTELLRAWDAADELVLRHLAVVDDQATTVVLNDSWGALATALAERGPVVVSDSYVARVAIAANVRRGAGAEGHRAVRVVADVDRAPARVDVAIVRVPKSLALLRHQLRRLAPRLHPASVVVGAGMTKHLAPGAHLLFEQLIGPTRPSRAEKKARLILCEPDAARVGGGPAPALASAATTGPRSTRSWSSPRA